MDMKPFEAEASSANEVIVADLPHPDLSVAPRSRTWLRPVVLDRAEQVVITCLWIWLVYRVAHAFNPDAWLILISETAIMVFTLIRRPTNAISLDLGDWLLAITATAAPMLIQPAHHTLPLLRPLGMVLVLLGNLWQAGAKLSLRRSFGIAPANRGVKISGVYRYMRHPMYAGYLFAHIGVLIMMPSVLNVTIYTIGWAAQIKRLLAEEALLGRDPAYQAYKKNIRWRLVPGLF